MKEFRAFYYTNEAVYFNEKHPLMGKAKHEIMFGIYCEDDYGNDARTIGEMSFKWYELFGSLNAKLEVYDDAWKVLSYFSDLIQELAKHNNKNITPKHMMLILKELGFKDKTKRSI